MTEFCLSILKDSPTFCLKQKGLDSLAHLIGMLVKAPTKLCPHKKRKTKQRLLMMSVAPFLGLVKKQYSVTHDITSFNRKQLPVLCWGRGTGYSSYEAALLALKKFMNLTNLTADKNVICLILVFKGFFVHSILQHSKVL